MEFGVFGRKELDLFHLFYVNLKQGLSTEETDLVTS
jgi:hypothetical protein